MVALSPYVATDYWPPGFAISEPAMIGIETEPSPSVGPPAKARPVKFVALIVTDENARAFSWNVWPPRCRTADLPTDVASSGAIG